MVQPKNADSKIFSQLRIANGDIKLNHRIILAPLTRNRNVPCIPKDPLEPVRTWCPDEVVVEYYRQRTTEGGLLVSEGINPNQQGGGMPGTPGLWLPEHIAGWKKVVDAVHAKGGYIYCQLWHQGRTTIEHMTGMCTVSPSGVAWNDPEELYPYPVKGCRGEGESLKLADYTSIEMTVDMIKDTISDFCEAARRAVEECGFDGVEVHGANGYLPEQFLSDNTNLRTDHYGGTPQKACNFSLELMEGLAGTVGQQKVAIRLSPFGMYNQIRGTKRMETFTHLCRQLKSRLPNMSYASFIEPRYEQVFSANEKDAFLRSWGLASVDLSIFRKILGSTPFLTAGGWNDTNVRGLVESSQYDAVVMGRWFTSNPDLPQRLLEGRPLRQYERERFYGPFQDRERGYTDYDPWCQNES
ncbi:FMN-linked oxidoreductase [Pseudovirgaria hyperparasitica]|uniref:FMN-linked oxidoreductase n=1 Tax=Pseudovirgaria hyperparasitica TaxID=470096 RepID=A0A6A6WGY0_9PEZI|nr:FMN-linked oxidoreductase [Pseudovirgaria hyperparasitica]KAF2761469.1 FMN-linked oxidoreductase [Pseudovirgaria hyperparasitica]